MKAAWIVIFLITAISRSAGAEDCGAMEVWDVGMAMCMPLAMPSMSMRMLMVHGNIFGVFVSEQGPRGRDSLVAPNMVMADLGSSWGEHHYFNLDLMGTAELWTFPDAGYPELLQIGETNKQGMPFLDAQHPHSSPIMGVTLSDTISFGPEKNHLKVFFAPRGESTDGPIAFMHRETGMVNPDAPLGHHIGQDVGHISSTVIGASVKWGATRLEASTFHGAEPNPEAVNLPLGSPDSFALRLIEEFDPQFTAMISAAYVNNPEPDEPDVGYENRYSASLYTQARVFSDWSFANTLIAGLVQNYDHATTLVSFGEEFVFKGVSARIWGRAELLQRTPAELEIQTSGNPNQGEFVGALTLGYTQKIASFGNGVGNTTELGVGGSVTKDGLPGDYIQAYGGNPWTGKVFLQFGGMRMFDF